MFGNTKRTLRASYLGALCITVKIEDAEKSDHSFIDFFKKTYQLQYRTYLKTYNCSNVA